MAAFSVDWTRRQRRALGMLVFLGLTALAYQAWQRPWDWFEPPPLEIESGDVSRWQTLDPNAESWLSLSRIPGLGKARAQALVDYRNAHGPSRVFCRPEDLLKVPGIGPGVLTQIQPYLKFPAGALQPFPRLEESSGAEPEQ